LNADRTVLSILQRSGCSFHVTVTLDTGIFTSVSL